MRGYLLPHPPILLEQIGNGRQHEAERTLKGYKKVKNEIAEYNPDITVVITPHGPLFSDGLAIYNTQPLKGDFSAFGASNISASYKNDERLMHEIVSALYENLNILTVLFDEDTASDYNMSAKLDHGAMVPLIMSGIESSIVVINYGLLSYLELYKVGIEIGELLDRYDRPLIIASGDLSHKLKDEGPYDYDPAGPKFDKWIIDAFENNDMMKLASVNEKEIKAAGECGMRSVQIMLGAFDKKSVKSNVFSYEGPFGVGYGIVGIKSGQATESLISELEIKKENIKKEREQNLSEPVKLAAAVIEKAVVYGEKSAIRDEYDTYKEVGDDRKGVFVSIKNNHGLRGCIGTFLPTKKSVREEIIGNAIQASLHDPRFSPIEPNELDDLIISVDYLSEPENIESKEELDPVRYGVIVSKGFRRGLLLPNLSGVDTVDAQIRIAREKAGIAPDEEVDLQRFEVVRYE